MRIFMTFAAALILTVPALAASAEPAPTEASADTEKMVELPMLVAPVTVNGRLYHYAYMRILLKAKDGKTAWTAREEKVPFILDALLRETHRASIALDNDPDQIDGDALKARLLAAANALIGEGSFVEVEFRDTIQTDDPKANQHMAEEPLLTAKAPAPAASSGH
jgi:hypothetical protein